MFVEYNANPYGANIDDCIIRAITKGTGRNYFDVMDGLIDIADSNDGWEIDDIRTANKYLISNGWEFCLLDGRCTVKQFSEQITDPRLIVVNGHMTYSEGGNVYDTWNCNRYKVKYVYRKCNS